MATMDEVAWCLDFLKLNKSGPVTLLHCTTQYPAEAQFCNLSVIKTLADKFEIPIGYSDHTQGIDIPIAAVALGAVVIEKHFTLDKNMDGPDHAASLQPKEFLEMVEGIRRVEISMGDGVKRPFPVEIEIAKIARKSLVAKHFLPKGHILTLADLTAKRPGTGIPAINAEQLKNQKLLKNIDKDEPISWKIVKPF
jgi:sialic acid synthase SpsE